jgi:hypothetical protein
MRFLKPIELSSRLTYLVLAIGCTSATTPQVKPSPASGQRKSTQADSSALNPDRTAYALGRLQYDLHNSSVVLAIAGDSSHQADSTRLVGIVTATLATAPTHNTILARVQFDSGLVTHGSGTSVPIPPSSAAAFTLNTQTGQVAHEEGAQDCTTRGVDSSPISGREVLPIIHAPAEFTWVDTLQTSTCRSGTLLSITRIEAYARLQASDSTLQLSRFTQFQITGNGHQWGQQIKVSGHGTAIDTLRLDRLPLRLREIVGSSQIKLSFTTALRLQEFIQTSTTHIVLRSQ